MLVHTIFWKKQQIFEMSSKKKILEVPPFTTEKRTMLAHRSQCDTPPVSQLTPGACISSHIHCMCLKLRTLAFPGHRCYHLTQQDSGLNIHHKKKINDITNAANRGIWHSEHAKKLTLMTCHNGLSFLKKKSLHILKCNGPRES